MRRKLSIVGISLILLDVLGATVIFIVTELLR